MNKKVVVTGVGVVSSIGIGKEDFWENLALGKTGIEEIKTFDVADYPVSKGGEIKKFEFNNYFRDINKREIGKASQFAIVATKLACEDANVDLEEDKNIGVIIGTTLADAQSLEQIDKHWIQNSEDDVWLTNIRNYPGYNLANNISYHLGLRGLDFVVSTACAAGNYSISFAYDLIRQSKYDTMIVGGADPIARTNLAGFTRLIAIAPEKCQPFDKNRKGMMVGEGAGILILEDFEHAKKRGAKIYAEVLGYGLSCDAYHMAVPGVEGITKVMKKAIKNSGIKKEDVDYICAHGTGTFANDKAECEAIKKVFGERTKEVAVNSIKSMLGHTMGAASAIEAISCCLSINEGIIPPTINYETHDPECDIDCVANVARRKDIEVALNNSFAFGGNNACLVLGRKP